MRCLLGPTLRDICDYVSASTGWTKAGFISNLPIVKHDA